MLFYIKKLIRDIHYVHFRISLVDFFCENSRIAMVGKNFGLCSLISVYSSTSLIKMIFHWLVYHYWDIPYPLHQKKMELIKILYSNYNSKIMYIFSEQKAIILLEGKYVQNFYNFSKFFTFN